MQLLWRTRFMKLWISAKLPYIFSRLFYFSVNWVFYWWIDDRSYVLFWIIWLPANKNMHLWAVFAHLLLSLKIWKCIKCENQSSMKVDSTEYFLKIFICFLKRSIFLVIDYYILEFLSSYYALNFRFCYGHIYIFFTHATLLESNSTSLISSTPTT